MAGQSWQWERVASVPLQRGVASILDRGCPCQKDCYVPLKDPIIVARIVEELAAFKSLHKLDQDLALFDRIKFLVKKASDDGRRTAYEFLGFNVREQGYNGLLCVGW